MQRHSYEGEKQRINKKQTQPHVKYYKTIVKGLLNQLTIEQFKQHPVCDFTSAFARTEIVTKHNVDTTVY